MKFTLLIFILGTLIYGCKNKELPVQYLSDISVIREAEGGQTIPQSTPSQPQNTEKNQVVQPQSYSSPRYHIIVGSFGASEKARAEQLVEKLKAQDYPASLITSSQRYRVSIESFPNETEANAARDEYRKITDRQDIWVHKVN